MEPAALRIIDANLNRAAESLRVIEEYARFVLDDADAATRIKAARHALNTIVEALGGDALLAARDVAGDVGRESKTAAELQRSDVGHILAAAFSRLGQAARTLGEYAKLSPDRGWAAAAAQAEALRYDSYELHQLLRLRGDARTRFRAVRLYVLLTERLCRRPWLETAAAALLGGAGCLQLREKDLPDAELLRRARQLRDLTRRHNALLIINDRPDIAALCQADGVHVGQDDLSVADARRVAGQRLLVGRSTHTPEQVAMASAEKADYIAVGAMFASSTKPQAQPAGIDLLVAAAAQTALPIVAVGGIVVEDVAGLLQRGAACVAVSSAVIASDDPQGATERFVLALNAQDRCNGPALSQPGQGRRSQGSHNPD